MGGTSSADSVSTAPGSFSAAHGITRLDLQAAQATASAPLSRRGRETAQAATQVNAIQVARSYSHQGIQERIRNARLHLINNSGWTLSHGRLSLFGLLVVQCLRLATWLRGEMPVKSVSLLHALSASADLTAILVSVPLILDSSPEGSCVKYGCVGFLLTLSLTTSTLDSIAWISVVAMQQWPAMPRARGVFSIAFLSNAFGAWNCCLLASAALEISLCVSIWRFYKALRLTGLYPPSNDALKKGEPLPDQVSPLEMLCEGEDVELLKEFNPNCSNCCGTTQSAKVAKSKNPQKIQYSAPAPLEELRVGLPCDSYPVFKREIPAEDTCPEPVRAAFENAAMPALNALDFKGFPNVANKSSDV